MNQKNIAVTGFSHAYLNSLYTQISNRNFNIYYIMNRLDLLRGIRKADIIHLHWIESYLFRYDIKFISFLKSFIFITYLIIVKYILGKKIVVTLHNIRPHRRLHPTLEHKMFRLTLRLSDGVIVHNNYSKRMTCNMYNTKENKIWVIPHGNFGLYYPNNISKEEARDILKIPKNKFVMLFFGGIRPNKGVEELLTILNDILIYEKDLFIIIAGKCNDTIFKKMIFGFSNRFKQESLINLEYISDEDIQIFMNASDVGILPYREITTSGVLLLFTSFKKPVIIPDLEPMKELLQDAGIYYDHCDSKDLQRVIIETKSGASDLDELSQKVYNISQKYQWDDIANKTIDVYDNIMLE